MKRVGEIGAVAAVGVGLCLALAGPASGAPGGYGPAVPTGPTGTPGGYSSVVTTKTFSPAGGTLSSAVAGGTLEVTVPAGAFAASAQIELTTPNLAQITGTALAHVGFGGYHSVAGFGVKVLDGNGQAMTGTFAKPIAVTLRATGISGADKVLRLDGSTRADVVPSTVKGDAVSVELDQDPNLVVVAPKAGGTSATVPGATESRTGLPLNGELLIGGLLVVAGVGAFAATRRTARG